MGMYDLPTLRTDQIRLLRVKLKDVDQIQCSVSIHDLNDERTEFFALSYTWGPCHRESVKLCRPHGSTRSSRLILCNEKPVEVTENLRDFLYQWTADHRTSTFLWIDALCIDQDNVSEQSHQVHIMGQIYTTAKHVLIWLGPEDDSTELAFRLVEGLSSMKAEARRTLDPHKVSADNENPLLDLARWKALSRFFTRTWFSRAWIIQEAILARSSTVMCGPRTTSWEALTDTSKFLATSAWTTFLEDPTLFKDHANQLHKCPARLLAQYKTWKGSYKDGLLYALIRARPSICQDPKDKVYSQLHLGQVDMFPNYEHSVAEVYTIAAKHVLEQSESMLLLTCVEGEDFQTHTYGLPSWVPDWSIAEFTGLRVTGYRHFNAAEQRLPTYSISHDMRTLSIEAVKVDDIVEICEEKKILRANLQSSTIWRLLSMLDSTYSTKHGTQTRGEVLWRALMTNRGSTPTDRRVRYPAPDQIGQSFRSWVLWRYALATGAPTAFPVSSATDSMLPTQDELEKARLRARSDLAYLANLAHKASLYDLHFSHAMLQRPFRTRRGYFGLGTQCLRKGDCVWIVSGCRVPIVLRRIDGSKHFRLVGGSYTHGLMDGEGLNQPGAEFEMVNLE